MDAVSRQTGANVPGKIRGGSSRWDVLLWMWGCGKGCWMQDRGASKEDWMGDAMVGMGHGGRWARVVLGLVTRWGGDYLIRLRWLSWCRVKQKQD